MRTSLVLGVVVSLALASVATADEKQAEREFRKGEEFFAEKEYRSALKHYRRAYEAADIPDLLFNIAQCHRNLGEYRKAADNFRLYLDEADEPSNEDEVERTLEQLDILAKALRHVRARRYEKAIEKFDEALEIEQLAPVHRDRGQSLERVGEYQDAIDSYRDYLSESPNAEDARDIELAIERLEKELNSDELVDPGPAAKPIYKKWWFWGAVGASVAAAVAITFVATDDGIPGSTLGNVEFDR